MAQYKVKYTLEDKDWVVLVKDVTNENEAVLVADSLNPQIPREASVKVEFISE